MNLSLPGMDPLQILGWRGEPLKTVKQTQFLRGKNATWWFGAAKKRIHKRTLGVQQQELVALPPKSWLNQSVMDLGWSRNWLYCGKFLSIWWRKMSLFYTHHWIVGCHNVPFFETYQTLLSFASLIASINLGSPHGIMHAIPSEPNPYPVPINPNISLVQSSLNPCESQQS